MKPHKFAHLLTPELRAHFESVGEDLVHEDLRIYQDPDKKFAAIAWLHERAQERRETEARRFRWVMVVTVIGTVAAVAAAWFGWLAVSQPAAAPPVASPAPPSPSGGK
jgi:hypothetical protein